MIDLVTLAGWVRHYAVAPMVVIFVLIFITTYWPSRRAEIEQHGHIPLDDDRQGG
jgi:cbb3-type cytochrome oxidase subunit 3